MTGRDTAGLILGGLGLAVFVAGIGILLDVTYFRNIPRVQGIPELGLLVPNLIVGGYGLMEIGRYYGTAGGTEESRYFGPRVSVFNEWDQKSTDPSHSTITALWFRVFWIGLAGQVIWAGLTLTGLVTGLPGQILRYTTLLVTVLAAYYDMQFIAEQAQWPLPQRWFLAFAVFPLNIITAGAYVRIRNKRLAESGESKSDRNVTTSSDTARAWITPGWHYVITLATAGWLPILLVSEITLSTGPLIAVFIGIVWLALPTAIARDSRQFAESEWKPRRWRWILGSLLPLVNLVVGPVYLLRRYEATQE